MLFQLSLSCLFLERQNILVVLGGNLLQCPQNRTGTGRNLTTDDNVLFQTAQFVNLAINRSFGQNTGRLLERCG